MVKYPLYRHAYFGNGRNVEIGDYSGIGENRVIPNNTVIGKYVMMAPEVYIASKIHCTIDTKTPMCFQGYVESKVQTIIGDDCWICQRVIMTPGHTMLEKEAYWLLLPLLQKM